MFISNKEKNELRESFEHNKVQIESLVKHVGKLQVDMVNTDSVHIEGVRNTNSQLLKMYWGADKKIKTLEKNLTTAQTYVEALTKKNASLVKMVDALNIKFDELERKLKKPVGRPPKKITIPADKVQAMKETGVWDDPIRRINFIDHFIKDEQERIAEAKKIKHREAAKKYYQNKKAKKAAQKELL